MKRLHLFETHDPEWCPRTIRDAETDYGELEGLNVAMVRA